MHCYPGFRTTRSFKLSWQIVPACVSRDVSKLKVISLVHGGLINLSLPFSEANDPAAVAQFAWIPSEILRAALRGDVEIKFSLSEHNPVCDKYSLLSTLRYGAESTLSQYILPLPPKGEDEGAWADQLLVIMRHLDHQGSQALLSLSSIQGRCANSSWFFYALLTLYFFRRPLLAQSFVDVCADFNVRIF